MNGRPKSETIFPLGPGQQEESYGHERQGYEWDRPEKGRKPLTQESRHSDVGHLALNLLLERRRRSEKKPKSWISLTVTLVTIPEAPDAIVSAF